MTQGLRVVVRVKPGASRPRVGGCHADDQLVVAVSQRPVDGAANEAVRSALARVFGVATRDVSVISGATARTKVLHIDGDADALQVRRGHLLRSP